MATVPLKSSGFLIFGRNCVLLTSLLLVTKAEAADFFVRDNTNQSRTLQTYRHSKGSYDDTTDEYEIKVPSGKYAEVRVSGERTSEDVACASGLCVGSRQYRNSDIVLTCNEGTSYVTVRLAISYFDYQIYACHWMYYIRITYYDLPTYVIKYSPGTYGVGSPQTATKTKGEKLVLKDAIFTRTDYLQTGWSKTDGGEKAYDLGASYTADAAITLYPFWKQRVPAPDLSIPSISTLPASPIMKGDEAVANFTVRNAGEVEAGQTIARIFDRETMIGEIAIEPLSSEMSCEKSFVLPPLSVGSHILSVVVVGVPGEMDTDNNSSATLTFEVKSFGGFSVIFNANGGVGVMDDQEFDGRTLKLASNKFSKEGYVFVGWSRHADEEPCYADESVVTRKALSITDPNSNGDSLTLYAAWGKEMARSIAGGILERLYPNVVFYTGGSNGSWSESTKNTMRSNGRRNWIAAKVRGPGSFSYTATETSAGNDVACFYGFVGGTAGYEGLVVEDLRDYFHRYGQFKKEVVISSEIDCVLGWGWYSPSKDEDYMQLSDVSWVPANSYEVRFVANGGTGTVPSMSCEPRRIYNLPKNEFTNGNRRFAGWACSNGRRYDDGMLVFNLAEPGETVTMTAIWEMSDDSNGVQLWEGGPYWATCNVGATKPEECGYYFWWGDIVGYKRNASNNGWISVKDGVSYSFSDCPRYGRNLVAANDAATAHLGEPWRMPTEAEIYALIQHCDTEWTMWNGVYGRLVKGRGAYASKSIFLPAAGYGRDSSIDRFGEHGYYWSSTRYPGYSDLAWCIEFYSGPFNMYGDNYRYRGLSVRPVRDF